ncbi:hypothetical protein, partial [Dialister succinatiphilus]|uniref:hypothetical protein n=1 Tax=Dialister succinatiphilus TaxID=487173 RepID=UPI004027C5B4
PAGINPLISPFQTYYMRVLKVQRVQKVKGRGWRRGLGRRFARFALRAMSIKNYPHRFAKLVP